MKKVDARSLLLGILFVGFILLSVSWTGLGDDSNNSLSVACSSDGSIVYVTSDRHLYISRDGGDSWEQTRIKGD